YEFSCKLCAHLWRESIEVREIEDSEGGSWHYYYVSGLPAAAPAFRNVCPKCKQTSVEHRQVDRRRIGDES
ncbi:MAG: hypothetical protein WA580_05585, partial [Acidimicrobiales bacterium]